MGRVGQEGVAEGVLHYLQCFTRFVIDLITMVLRSSYTQSVFSVYPIYTEDIIERYLIKSVNFFSGRAERAGRIGKAGSFGDPSVMVKGRCILPIAN